MLKYFFLKLVYNNVVLYYELTHCAVRKKYIFFLFTMAVSPSRGVADTQGKKVNIKGDPNLFLLILNEDLPRVWVVLQGYLSPHSPG